MRFCVVITTCNRPELFALTLSDTRRELSGHESRIVVVDDCSDEPYGESADGIIYHRMTVRQGKDGYWRVVNAGLRAAARHSFDRLLFFPDDVRLKPGAIAEAVKLWDAIESEKKIALQILQDDRAGKKSWTNWQPVQVVFGGERFWHSQWIETCFIATPEFLDVILPLPHIHRPPYLGSSGVQRHISMKLHRLGYEMYQVVDTLVSHGDHESLMNPQERKRTPLVSSF